MTDHLFILNLRQNSKLTEPLTSSSFDQSETERIVKKAYQERFGQHGKEALRLCRESHISFYQNKLINLPSSFDCLDASQCWMSYWITHGLALLKSTVKQNQKDALIKMLNSCQSPTGGYGGGPYQLSHLATTYGAVNCLCLLGSPEALNSINRQLMYEWLSKVRHFTDCSFRMHEGGEVDVRGAYCAISVATLLNLNVQKLFEGTAEWIAQCQTYEGGFGGVPGMEAHGGYSFCAFAALVLLEKTHLIDVQRLLRWATSRQMALEGGFQGRTNKLVDSCYSFWVGGLFPLIQAALANSPEESLALPPGNNQWLFDSSALQDYLLVCCQKTTSTGGMIDKPGKNADLYHTCYALSGLSIAQHQGDHGKACPHIVSDDDYTDVTRDEVEIVDTRFNVTMEAAQNALFFFKEKGMLGN